MREEDDATATRSTTVPSRKRPAPAIARLREQYGCGPIQYTGTPADAVVERHLLMGLPAAEISAVTLKDPGEHFHELTARFGAPSCTRLDVPATPEQKARLAKLSPEEVRVSTLAGKAILARLTRAPDNGASIGGLKVVTRRGWFAARPSGTENLYKIHAKSLVGPSHLDAIVAEARALVDEAMGSSA